MEGAGALQGAEHQQHTGWWHPLGAPHRIPKAGTPQGRASPSPRGSAASRDGHQELGAAGPLLPTAPVPKGSALPRAFARPVPARGLLAASCPTPCNTSSRAAKPQLRAGAAQGATQGKASGCPRSRERHRTHLGYLGQLGSYLLDKHFVTCTLQQSSRTPLHTVAEPWEGGEGAAWAAPHRQKRPISTKLQGSSAAEPRRPQRCSSEELGCPCENTTAPGPAR